MNCFCVDGTLNIQPWLLTFSVWEPEFEVVVPSIACKVCELRGIVQDMFSVHLACGFLTAVTFEI